MTESGIVIPFNAPEHAHLTPYLAAIHASCITHDRTIATFLPPLSHEKLLTWWKAQISEVEAGRRQIYLLLSEADSASKPKGPEVMGVAMLQLPQTETGPFRASVEKLLVHKNWRRRGGARALLAALEADAANRGRTILVSLKR